MMPRHHRLLLCAAAVFAGGLSGCGDNPPTGTKLSPELQQYWALQLNHHAITLANVSPYDTLTLVATPTTPTGAPLATSSQVVYTSSDTSVVVTPDGKIRAHTTAELTTDVQIVATLTVGGVRGTTLADTAYVNVVGFASAADVPVVSHFALLPMDSAQFSYSMGYGGFYGEADDNEPVPQPIPWIQVYYHTPSNQVMTFDRYNGGYAYSTGVGHAMLYADAVIYGKAVRDSIRATSGYKTRAYVGVSLIDSTGAAIASVGFPRDTMFLGLGGVVVWYNGLWGASSDSIDVEFTGPAPTEAITDNIYMSVIDMTVTDYYWRDLTIVPDGGGDIPPWTALPPDMWSDDVGASAKARRFTVPGTYTYHSRFFPGTGTIVVIANTDIP